MKTALLLSGGMDSIAIAYWLKPDIAVTVDYGQKPAQGELRAASAAADAMMIEHKVVRVDLSRLGSGDLAGKSPLRLASVSEWWPYRNQMLVTLAAMSVVDRGVSKLLIGTIASDCVHADGKSTFVEAIDNLMMIQEGELRVEAPAIRMSTAELCRSANIPRELLAWAHSCHKSDYACGMCRGCQKHYRTLQDLGLEPY